MSLRIWCAVTAGAALVALSSTAAPVAAAPAAVAVPVAAAPAAAAAAVPVAEQPTPRQSSGDHSGGKSADQGNLDQLKQGVVGKIDKELAMLAGLDSTVVEAGRLTATHRATLVDTIAAVRSGLAASRFEVLAETTHAGVKARAKTISETYRVRTLVEPKVRLSIAVDTEAAAADRLAEMAETLERLVAEVRDAGRDTTEIDSVLNDMRTGIGQAQAAIAGRGDALLAMLPGADGPALASQVGAIREAVRASRKDLKVALMDAKKIRAAVEKAWKKMLSQPGPSAQAIPTS